MPDGYERPEGRHITMKTALESYLRRGPFIAFLPFLFLYVVTVLALFTDELTGDETRYIQFADNLLEGFYSPPPPAINLWSGPGLPLVIAPLRALGLPLVSIGLLNALMQYLSVVFLFRTLRFYVPLVPAFLMGLAWALYYNAWFWHIHLIFTEILTNLLVVLLCFFLARAFRPAGGRTPDLLAAGALLGYLTLTKIIFGYVLLAMLAVTGLLALLRRRGPQCAMFKVLAVAMLVNVPYLVHTWKLTGRPFYWGNSGGMSLYWMSTPFEGETGDWHNLRSLSADTTTQLYRNHRADIRELRKLVGVEQDDAYKRMALANIRRHPVKYARNIMANISRLLFNTPYYFVAPTDAYILRLLPTCLLLPFLLFGVVHVLGHWRSVPREFIFLFLLVVLYLGATVLVSAYNRQFYITVPVLMLFASHGLHRMVRFKWKGWT